ncbi:MAG: hypothetical protein J5680_03585 [Neisseriaceae bacterium]|nr:hypothetical protein [Neisseriaceae bacterium]
MKECQYIVNSYPNHTALSRLAVLDILSAARCLVCFGSELTISFIMRSGCLKTFC